LKESRYEHLLVFFNKILSILGATFWSFLDTYDTKAVQKGELLVLPGNAYDYRRAVVFNLLVFRQGWVPDGSTVFKAMAGLAFLLTFLVSASLYAGPWNYENTLIGERIVGMGGTAVANGNELASSYYNPAGLAYAIGSEISMTGNLYSKIDVSLTDQKGLFSALKDQMSQGGVVTIPAAWGAVRKRKQWAIGFYIFIPSSYEFNGQYNIEPVTGKNTRGYISTSEEASWYGVTFATRITDNFSLGGSITYSSRKLNEQLSATSLYNNSADVSSVGIARDFAGNSFTLAGGMQYRLDNGFSFGTMMRLPSLSIGGSGKYYRSDIRTVASVLQDTSATYVNQENINSIYKIPMKIAFGVAYQKIRNHAIALDLSVYPAFKFKELDSENSMISREVYGNTIFNFNIGGEYYLFQRWVLRSGFFTNSSSAKDPDENIKTFQPAKIDFKGFSMTLSHESDRSTVTAGGYYMAGGGKGSLLFSDGNYYVYPRSENYFTFVLSSTYFF
jgi:hypothetical protein